MSAAALGPKVMLIFLVWEVRLDGDAKKFQSGLHDA